MFSVLAKAISSEMVNNEVIQPEDEPIYTYGIQQSFSIMLNLISTFAIAWLFHQLLATTILMLAFIPLRSFAGGFHASTPMRCYLLSVMAIIFQIFAIEQLLAFHDALIIWAMPALIILFTLVPVEDANKPLDQGEKIAFKRKTRQLSLLLGILLFVFVWFGFDLAATAIFVSLYSVAILVIAGLYNNRRLD